MQNSKHCSSVALVKVRGNLKCIQLQCVVKLKNASGEGLQLSLCKVRSVTDYCSLIKVDFKSLEVELCPSRAHVFAQHSRF